MHIDGWTLLLQAINLVVLLALLRWLLYRPLLAVIDKRRQRTEAELTAAAEARGKADSQAQALADEREALVTSRGQLLQQVRQQAEAERQVTLAQAEQAARQAQAQARNQLARERQDAREALLGEAGDLAVSLAARLLGSAPAPQGDAAFVQALLDRVDATPAAERQAWLDPAAAPRVTLVSASALTAAQQAQALTRLRAALGSALSLDTRVEPALLRGAELRWAHGVLALNWSVELAAARVQLAQVEILPPATPDTPGDAPSP